MAKKQYRYSGTSKWMGVSGNAILALYNTPGSGKKFAVHSVEIYNKNQLGYQNGAANANQAAPVRIKVCPVTAIVGGENVPLVKLNSAAADFPSTIQIKTKSEFTETYVNWNGTVTYTDATVAIGDVTFTPGSAPAWIANEHRDAERYFKVDSGGNAGVYGIVSNTTTDLTLDRPFISATSTTGYVCEYNTLTSHGVLKQSLPSVTCVPVRTNGYTNQNFYGGSGTIWARGNSTNQQEIYVLAGEKISILVNKVNCSLPMFVEATFVVEGTPNRTYTTSFYTYLDSERLAVLSIDNNTGSGQVLRILRVSVTEVGTLDTPYFQLVPIGSIEPSSFTDSDKQLTVFPTNSAHGSLATNVGRLFTNVPVLPFGVPTSYIAEGAPAAATPRGFNYLNAKDFIGPAYMTYFPESAAFKIPNTSFWTAGAPGTFGTHVSQEYSKIKGFGGAPIIIREGETLGIVSGAETATGTVSMGLSGFGGYEFSLTFTVEDAVTPTVELTGLKSGSEVRAYVGTDPATAVEIGGTDSSSTSFSFTHDVASQNGYIMIFHLDWQPIKLDFTPYLAAVVSIPIQQVVERNYSNP